MLCHDQMFKVAERLFWVESHEEYWQCQIVLGDQEVLRVVNEDGVLERGVQVQVDLMIFSTRVPVKMKSVTTTKHHVRKMNVPWFFPWFHQRDSFSSIIIKKGIFYNLIKVKSLLLNAFRWFARVISALFIKNTFPIQCIISPSRIRLSRKYSDRLRNRFCHLSLRVDDEHLQRNDLASRLQNKCQ